MIKKIPLLIGLFFVLITNVYASTTTMPRLEPDYGVSSNIIITDTNKSYILNTPKVNASEKIYDFADLFTTEEELLLYKEAQSFINDSSYDLAIVTIDNNPKSSYKGESPTTVYADDFHDYNDFSNDAIVFLIDMENRKYYISTSGEAILMYDDDRIERILDAGESYMKSSNYYQASQSIIDKLQYYYQKGIPVSNQNCEILSTGEYICHKKLPYALIGVISALVSALVTFLMAKSYKKIRIATKASEYLVSDKSEVTTRNDQYVNSTTTRVKIESSSSGGGGSSSHSSSSGGFHGGGGRGF